jgi:hypothetical protein
MNNPMPHSLNLSATKGHVPCALLMNWRITTFLPLSPSCRRPPRQSLVVRKAEKRYDHRTSLLDLFNWTFHAFGEMHKSHTLKLPFLVKLPTQKIHWYCSIHDSLAVCMNKSRSSSQHSSKVRTPVPLHPSQLNGRLEAVAHDPWKLLIAVTLLNKTAGKLAIPTFWKLIEQWPTPYALSQGNYTLHLPAQGIS